jgi:hypothetical protein
VNAALDVREPDEDELEDERITDAEMEEAAERWFALRDPVELQRYRRELIASDARAAMHMRRHIRERDLFLPRALATGARPRERRPRRTRRLVRAGGSSRDGPSDPDPSDDELSGAASRRAA